MASIVLQVRKSHIFWSWKGVFKNINLEFLSEPQYISEYTNTPGGQGENHKIRRSENVTCRNLAYIPNTQPFSLSSKGKNKWEVRAASCTEENTLGRWEEERGGFFLKKLSQNEFVIWKYFCQASFNKFKLSKFPETYILKTQNESQ